MSGSANPRGMLDRLVGACLSLLVAGAAVFIAVRLVEAVWTVLLVILGVGMFMACGVVLLLRSRRGGW